MSDKDKWKKEGGFPIDGITDIEREYKCRKTIEKLVKNSGWRLERPIGNLLGSVILVETKFRSNTSIGKRSLQDIEKFNNELEGIANKFRFEIKEFIHQGISNDGYRRIEIKLKNIN